MASSGATRQVFSPANTAFEARVRASFARQGIMAHIGAELSRVEPGYCEILLPFQPQLSQQHGFFHGGVVGTIADSAAGYAGMSLMPADTSVLTVEYKLNLLAPADGDRLLARGEVVRAGRTLIVSKADVYVSNRGQEKPCATLLQTLMTMRGMNDALP